jgi:hypothetical protein
MPEAHGPCEALKVPVLGWKGNAVTVTMMRIVICLRLEPSSCAGSTVAPGPL